MRRSNAGGLKQMSRCVNGFRVKMQGQHGRSQARLCAGGVSGADESTHTQVEIS